MKTEIDEVKVMFFIFFKYSEKEKGVIIIMK